MSKADKIIIATIKSWNINNAKGFCAHYPGINARLITNNKRLSYKTVSSFKPRYIFLPHWSWMIDEKIYKNYECVLFHLGDLPFARGGSPLQNLIERGYKKTKITAFLADKAVDSGSVYLKRSINLSGSASEIFKRTSSIIFNDMIPYIIKNNPQPKPQKGETVVFKRRRPGQSNIANLKNISKVYDYIRMLDAEGYPAAYLNTGNLNIEFKGAKLKNGYILAQAKIEVKK
ncbi:MAG: methionyl-tRNA formyltransferase [Candidatus Omnitrophota bacterium]